MTTGGVMLYLCTRPKADFQNKDEAFAINHKSYQLKIPNYVYKCSSKHLELVTSEGAWFFDLHPTCSRSVLVRFSLGSRWVLVRSSFVSRSSLVAYSLVYRRPIENRTRIERISNERRTKEDRENDGKPSKIWWETVQFDGMAVFCFPMLSQMSWTVLLLSLQDVG